MVSENSTSKNIRPGLLPPPKCSPISDSKAINFVGNSTYPLPYEAVVVLEGCSIVNILSWDMSVSPKVVKVKVEWSCQPNSSIGCILHEKFPKNLIEALRLHNLARPSWSLSSSTSKITTHFEWPISKDFMPTSPTESSSLIHNLPLPCSTSPKTPIYGGKIRNFDSGYKSFDLTIGRQDPKLQNWRQRPSPVSQPKFGPSPKISKHDIFLNSKPSSKPASTKDSSYTPENLKVLEASSIINSESTLATACVNNYPGPLKSDSSLETNSTIVSSPPNINQSFSSISSNSLPQVTNIVRSNIPNTSKSYSEVSSSDKCDLALNVSTKPNPINNEDNESSSDDEIPVPPPGFPKSFYPVPNPLPLMNDGFLSPKSKAFYMNLPGSCRLCDKKVASYLIDLHLLQRSGLDRQPLDRFTQSIMKKSRLKRKQVIEAAKLYNKFELNEKTIPKKYFKNSVVYDFFTNELESLTQELARTAFRSLNIPEEYENFNLLKYTE